MSPDTLDLSLLPPDVIRRILVDSDYRDIISFSRANHRYHDICSGSDLWIQKALREYPDVTDDELTELKQFPPNIGYLQIKLKRWEKGPHYNYEEMVPIRNDSLYKYAIDDMLYADTEYQRTTGELIFNYLLRNVSDNIIVDALQQLIEEGYHHYYEKYLEKYSSHQHGKLILIELFRNYLRSGSVGRRPMQAIYSHLHYRHDVTRDDLLNLLEHTIIWVPGRLMIDS